MDDATNARKLEHLEIIAGDRGSDRQRHYFDALLLRHRALPELDLSEVDPSVTFLGKRLAFPLLISSMTGGDDARLRELNRNLATAAEGAQVAMGVGSQRVMFSQPAARASFALREVAPTTVLCANLGAVQLNYGFGLEQCREAVAAVGADALFLHLNPLQEVVQPEGTTRFGGLTARIAAVTAGLPVPVILKEVGAGLSPADVELAIGAGVRYVDVAGAGGTSWSRIEHFRRAPGDAGNDVGLAFQDWGIPTPLALRLLAPYRDRVTLIASGGLRSGLDMVKAVILGASLCGLAAPFLVPGQQSADEVARAIARLRTEFVTAMFLLGVRTVDELRGNSALILAG